MNRTSTISRPLKFESFRNAMFWLFCPERLPETSSVRATKEAQGPMERSLHILVVEDILMNQEVAKIQLKKLGHTHEVANNGQEAIEILSKKDFEVVLMDGRMPMMDGFEATQKIRNASSPVMDHEIYVIGVSAEAMVGDRERFLAVGMNDYVSKPITEASIRQALTRALNHLKKHPKTIAPPASEVAAPMLEIIDSGGPDDEEVYSDRLIDLFLSETPNLIAQIDENLTQGNLEEVLRISHGIAGSSGYFKAKDLEKACRAIMALAKNQQTEGIDKLMEEVRQCFEMEKERLLQMKASRQGS
jgi:CheY-like chemotaxis protein/HPt (histidine-containing phosphotransfer) domain-containing protein